MSKKHKIDTSLVLIWTLSIIGVIGIILELLKFLIKNTNIDI